MELLLKREGHGRKLTLFAKLELTPDEKDIINKSRLRHDPVWPAHPARERAHLTRSLILAGLATLIVCISLSGIVGWMTGGAWVVLFVFISIPGAVGWLLVTRWLSNYYRESVSASDLLTGRTIRGDEEMLRIKQQAIREWAQQVSQYIAAWKAGGKWDGSSERIKL